MKKNIVLICVFISVVSFTIMCIYLANTMFYRSGYGKQYSINWRCSEYRISFTSYDEIFPFKSNEYKGKIFNDKKKEDIIINIDQGRFSFGVNGEPYTETYYNDPENYDVYTDFEEYASGEFKYNGEYFTVYIDKAKKEYKYLINKEMVFKKQS